MVSFQLHQYASMGKWSVLRVWDVLLFEGNRVMLFRTALGVLCQLVFTACMGYQDLNESRLQELRSKHGPTVMAAFEERLKGLQAWRDSKDLTTKLYNSKQDPKSVLQMTFIIQPPWCMPSRGSF
ncbi:unnamed protein product [Brassica napus]|uniref:(rape) hypothetical protein n=1 Tax=Brassica napus TaxID=3708 RepID=A0A817A4G4_BRANA|nr:unnamed protein product [Brassica napus]